MAATKRKKAAIPVTTSISTKLNPPRAGFPFRIVSILAHAKRRINRGSSQLPLSDARRREKGTFAAASKYRADGGQKNPHRRGRFESAGPSSPVSGTGR